MNIQVSHEPRKAETMNMRVIDDNQAKVKEALAIWADWMQRGVGGDLGYGRTMGFESGGSAISSWEDFENCVEKNMAVNVQAIYEGLQQLQQLAIDHFHLHAVWRSNRVPIENAYASALLAMEVGLRRRGLL